MHIEDESENQIVETEPALFEINSPERANWLVRKIVECRAYGARARDFAEREQRRAAREEKRLLWRFGRELEAWAASVIARSGGRPRSVSLPAGTLSYRRVGPRVVVDDAAAVLKWAREHGPEVIVTTERVSKQALAELMKATGVVPPEGAHIEPETDRFHIR